MIAMLTRSPMVMNASHVKTLKQLSLKHLANEFAENAQRMKSLKLMKKLENDLALHVLMIKSLLEMNAVLVTRYSSLKLARMGFGAAKTAKSTKA